MLSFGRSGILQIKSFSLEKHMGEYDTWPSKTRLFKDGEFVGKEIPGYFIERQFSIGKGYYFLITSYDCPFEEQCDLIMLNEDYEIIAKRSLIPWYYSSWNLDSHKYLSNSRLLLIFNTNYHIEVSLHPRKLFSWRKISLSRVNDAS